MIVRFFRKLFGARVSKSEPVVRDAIDALTNKPDYSDTNQALAGLQYRVEAAQEHLQQAYKILEIRRGGRKRGH